MLVSAQQDLANITWAQMDGVQELPNGDVILAQLATQSDGFCVTNLEVGNVFRVKPLKTRPSPALNN